jgi:hypothetical protein
MLVDSNALRHIVLKTFITGSDSIIDSGGQWALGCRTTEYRDKVGLCQMGDEKRLRE